MLSVCGVCWDCGRGVRGAIGGGRMMNRDVTVLPEYRELKDGQRDASRGKRIAHTDHMYLTGYVIGTLQQTNALLQDVVEDSKASRSLLDTLLGYVMEWCGRYINRGVREWS